MLGCSCEAGTVCGVGSISWNMYPKLLLRQIRCMACARCNKMIGARLLMVSGFWGRISNQKLVIDGFWDVSEMYLEMCG